MKLTSLTSRLLSYLLIFSCSLSTAQTTDDLQLPVLGDSSSAHFSLQQEYQLGRAWLKVFRSQIETVADPLLQDYLEDLIYRLATHSELKDRRLDIVVVDNKTLNAFAVPGGVIGVHNGLFLHADNEAQLSAVLSHELAHLSQRHFARGVEEQKRNAIPNMAAMLASLVIAATAGGNAGIAAMTATQAASLQNQLRFSRQNEQEADRIGMQTMAKAEMDPNAVATMFEGMMSAGRYAGRKPPEFLLTHPVTESRVSDARNRSRNYPRRVYTDNLDYQLMRARVDLHFANSSKDAVKRFRAKLAAKDRHPEAMQYGLTLALTRSGNFEEATQLIAPLLKANPNRISYLIAKAEIEMSEGKLPEAIDRLSRALALSPQNHPLTMTLAEALLNANQPHRAEALLKKHSTIQPNNPNVWYMLAETHGLAGNIIGVHQARAEYFVLNGVLDRAKKQLSYALPLVQNDHYTQVVIQERIKQIQRMEEAMKKL